MLFRGDFLELLEENQEEKGDQSGEDFLEFRLLRRGVPQVWSIVFFFRVFFIITVLHHFSQAT